MIIQFTNITLICWLQIFSFVYGQSPNIVLINIDDLGYADLSCYGSEKIRTPHIDRLAVEGRRFTDFMNASSICTPSRSALLTGCYPKRIGMERKVIFPRDTRGLHPNEETFAELVKKVGYRTACIGKWHVGHEPELLPTNQGFDYYYGIPFSNDMNRRGSQKKKPGRGFKAQAREWADQETALSSWDTPLLEGSKVIEVPVDQRTITRRYTDKAIEQINLSVKEQKPFLIYLAHSMPHLPLYVPDELWEEDFNQAYRITVEHIDSEVGRIVSKIRDSGLDKNTYIFFTSDNGPSPKQLGSAHPLRGKKFTNYEGGHRTPFIVWAPGQIPAGSTYDRLVTSLDLFPTIETLAGAKRSGQVIDGHDISELLKADVASPTDVFLYYDVPGEVVGIRSGDFKLFKDTRSKKPSYALYNLKEDVSEKVNILKSNLEVVDRLQSRMVELDEKIVKDRRPAWEGGSH